MNLAVLICGATLFAGIMLCWSAFWEPMPLAFGRPDTKPPTPTWVSPWQIPVASTSAVAVWLLTDWVPLGLAVAVLVMVGPGLVSNSGAEAGFADRTDAVAAWVESLRDTMRGSRGVEGALRVTADTAPVAIKAPLQKLNRHVSMGVGFNEAMADCADEIDNPVFDMIAAVLLNALAVSAAQVPSMLDDIASQARERAHSHLQIHTSRTKQRTQLRLVGIIVIVTIVGFVLMFGSYLAPLGTPNGQLVLSAATLAVGGLLGWIAELSALPPRRRVLDPRRVMAGAP